jgi:hypothetical protein
MKSPTTPQDAAFGLLAALLLAALAAPAAAGDRGVTLYKHVHFRGHHETFYGDVPNLGRSSIGNDRASSVEVPTGCRVTLYRDADFRGPAITVHQHVGDLGTTWIGNDEVSSLTVDCHGAGYRDRGDGGVRDRGDHRGRGYGRDHGYGRGYGYGRDHGYGDDRRRRQAAVTVFSDAGFRGYSESFSYDDPDLRDNSIGQDEISSISVAPGCRAVLFADVGFRGAATAVTGSDGNLGYSAVGNDRASSIQVNCRLSSSYR